MRKRSLVEIRRLIAAGAVEASNSAPCPSLSGAAHHLHHYLHLAAALGANPEALPPFLSANEVGDDRANLTLGAPVLLIVENDLAFARFLLDAAREKGFKGIVTSLGVSALALAAEYKPSAVTLDIFLPDIDGWRVLDRLKHDTQTRHIPVSVISTDESRERALNAGAFSFLSKPIQSKEMIDGLLDQLIGFLQQPEKHLLLVTADDERRNWLSGYFAANDIRVTSAADYAGAVAMVSGSVFSERR